MSLMSLTPRHSSGFTLHASFIITGRGKHSLNVIAPMDAQIENILHFINFYMYEISWSISSRSRVTLIVYLFSAISSEKMLHCY
jgi:hypothetical protein